MTRPPTPMRPTNTSEYIASFSPEIQSILEKIRATIQRAAPEAQEKMSYRMPAFALNGDVRMVSGVRMTVSEGVINSRYAMVGVQLLKDALVRQPQLFGLGMGGFHRPIARLLKSLKWRLIACPFYFRVVRPHRFLREIVPLRQQRSRRMAMDVLAWSGLGWCGITALHAAKGLRKPSLAGVTDHVVNEFGDWADSIWDRAVTNYSLIAVRSSLG